MWSTGAPRDAVDPGGRCWAGSSRCFPCPSPSLGGAYFLSPWGPWAAGQKPLREPQNHSVHGFLPEFGRSWGEGEYEVTTDENVSISNTSPAVF